MKEVLSLEALAARTRSGRWLRRRFVKDTYSWGTVRKFLDESTSRLSRMLAAVEMNGANTLLKMENTLFKRSVEDTTVFDIGDHESIGHVLLPFSGYKGIKTFFPVILIPIKLKKDGLNIWIQRDQSTGIRHLCDWQTQQGLSLPQESEVWREVFHATEGVLQILMTLDIPEWAELLAA